MKIQVVIKLVICKNGNAEEDVVKLMMMDGEEKDGQNMVQLKER